MGLCSPTLRRDLQRELLHLNFHAMLQTIMQLLAKMGYEDVKLAARTGFVGRNSDGGVDIRAYKWVPGGRRLVVIQVKQYVQDRLLYRKSIDELRGVVLRAGAAEGIMITTSGFSDSVTESDFASAAVAPIRLIDGIELTELMALYRVGVTKVPRHADVSESWYFLDPEFFKGIESEYSGVARPLAGERLVACLVISKTPRKRRSM
jgi:restriction endonuclease Mrr